MAATGGSYSQREISLLQKFFDISATDMVNVTRIYNRAQGSPKGFEPYALQIVSLFKGQETVLEELVGTLLKIAHSAPGKRAGITEMLDFTQQVASLFGFSVQEFERLKIIHAKDIEGLNDGTLIDYLSILSIPANATASQARRAYHKLVMENHPDKLISEGVPEEFIQLANEKLALINVAYEQYQAANNSLRESQR
jgi:DnaJ like chaperone protein